MNNNNFVPLEHLPEEFKGVLMLLLQNHTLKSKFINEKFEQELHVIMMKLYRRYFTPLKMFSC